MAELKVVSFSELDTIGQCWHKHQLSYIERWTMQQDTMSALAKGTAWHAVMEAHYRALRAAQLAGLDKKATTAAIADATGPLIAAMPDELATLIEWMYTGYLEMWGLDPEWEILAVEHNAQCRLPTPTGRPSQFALKMKIDLVVKERRTGHTRIVDHKSGKDLPHGKSLEFDDQFGLYTWGLRQLGHKVFAQYWNAARTLKTKQAQPLDSRFERTPLYRTEKELDEIALEAYQRFQSRYRMQAEYDRQGVDAPRTTNTMTCSWRCDYTDACLLGRKAGRQAEIDFLRAKGYVQDFTRH